MDLKTTLSKKGCTIVDVRSRDEFRSGHVTGSLNIPLQELKERIDEIRQLTSPLVLCCASGNRSAQAQNWLTSQNISCVNGGSWMDINYLQNK
ncbi:rhodanese-like domain-containing protein [Fluviicola taffensis]|uniref:Rhodanese-like protein n=1 Tax=Fluviicola taffensis (strain DSM 16823 / NCIMB 13979 / RW262) TaxID=755732 RepID=F2IJC2_FLUTR|nr:rhodanese-like domain-containing protein [Fluviicola taffensis]AEA44992.1 Rhodanese-like protein [Fluviicola taffensis DSM 16823]